MKASTLALLIVIYSVLGALLALATEQGTQVYIVIGTGSLLAFTLGAAWPIHRGFPIAGFLLGATIGAAFLLVEGVVLTQYDDRLIHIDRRAYWWLLGMSFAIYGAWIFVMMIGAATGWIFTRLATTQKNHVQA